MLGDAEQNAIAAAIAAQEDKTRGEIVCILAEHVSAYPEVRLVWAIVAAILLPPFFVWAGLDPVALVDWAGGWSASTGPASDAQRMSLLAGYTVLQSLMFLFAFGLASIPALRQRLTPKGHKKARVYRAALEQYIATGLHQSDSRTGVVIFASFEDHCVSIVADPLVHQAVGPEVWARAVAAVEDGMRMQDGAAGLIKAIEICGAALAEHFPGKSPNLLSNRPLEL
jgi:putative membrane protein